MEAFTFIPSVVCDNCTEDSRPVVRSSTDNIDANVRFCSDGYVEKYLEAEEFASGVKSEYSSLVDRFEKAFFRRAWCTSSWYMRGLLHSIGMVERGEVYCSTGNHRKLLRCIDEILELTEWLSAIQRTPCGKLFSICCLSF